MADFRIIDLTEATVVQDEDLFVMRQATAGEATKVKGSTVKSYAKAAGTAEIEALTVSAHLVPEGGEPTVAKTGGSGVAYNLDFGIPKGDKGDPATTAADVSYERTVLWLNTDNVQDAIELLASKDVEQDDRLKFLEAVTKGKNYIVETDSAETYSKVIKSNVVPEGNKASIDSFGGHTIVFNQLVQDGNSLSDTKWQSAGFGGSISYSDGVAEVIRAVETTAIAVTFRNAYIYKKIAGHKYCTLLSAKGSEPGLKFSIKMDSADSLENYDCTTSFARYGKIFTQNADRESEQYPRYYNASSNPVDSSIYFTNIMTFDLTQMFGDGNEPSTVAEVEALFPLDYYEYNLGELVSAEVQHMVSRKANRGIIGTYYVPGILRIFLADKGYGQSAGTAYNEVDFVNKKYIKRVGSVDMGSISWTLSSSGTELLCRGLNVKKPSSTDLSGNILCEKYATVPYVNQPLYTISVHNGYWDIQIKDDGYASAADFKSAMNGVMLCYELTEPVEYDISAYLADDMSVEVESGGTVTFKQQAGGLELPIPNTISYLRKVTTE